MMTIEAGEKPHVHAYLEIYSLHQPYPVAFSLDDDRFPIPLWETWFCQSLGVPIPVLLGNPTMSLSSISIWPVRCNGDHIQTCQCQSAALPAHEWIVYRRSLLLRSVGHKVKTHRITPATDNERVDIQIKDYVILPRGVTVEKMIGFSSHTRHGCHNDSWPIWTYHSAYKRSVHTQSVLHRCSSAWCCPQQGSQNEDSSDSVVCMLLR